MVMIKNKKIYNLRNKFPYLFFIYLNFSWNFKMFCKLNNFISKK